jgi:predicted RNA-binding Zn-ribbon protein involved in translation (DUF1610 family)
MKLLMLDIETQPNLVWTWGLFNQNIAINQIKQPGAILSWAAKWYGDKKIHYADIRDGKEEMLVGIYYLLEEADVVVHYNGTSFDIPTLNQEFLSLGWTPPAPFQQIDLLQTVRKKFRMTSNKLDYVSQYLGLGKKVKHDGFETWLGCMDGDEKSWKMMTKYNMQDVVLLEKLYNHIKPWISGHPNHALFTDAENFVCPNCGSEHVQKRGLVHTKTLSYQRWHCQDCGTWSRSRTSELTKEKRKVVLSGVS